MENLSTCPACGAPLKFAADGTKAHCEYCGNVLEVPASDGVLDSPERSLDEFQQEQTPAEPSFTFHEPVERAPEPAPLPYTPPPTPASSAGTNWTRVGIGCLSGCGTALLLAFGCGISGLVIERLARSGHATLPVRSLFGVAVPLALFVGLVVFLIIALTGKKR